VFDPFIHSQMFSIVFLHGPSKEFTCDVLIDQWEMGCVELGSG